MKRVALALVTTLVACGVNVPKSDDDSPQGSATTDLFSENCASCHGADAEGTTDAPQIREPVHDYATYVIRNGRASQMGYAQAMPSFATDELPDLTTIFAYLDRAPRPTDGAGLYLRFCGNCHGADAKGGRVGESPKDDDLMEKVRSGKGGTNFASRTKYMPAWQTTQLSDAEVDAIAAYLGTAGGGGDDDDGDGD